jgi:hypothetical protein
MNSHRKWRFRLVCLAATIGALYGALREPSYWFEGGLDNLAFALGSVAGGALGLGLIALLFTGLTKDLSKD